jgi:heme o synthase
MIIRVLKSVPALIKYKVSIAVTFTAITGYILFSINFDIHLIYMALGVFLLAGGSSALNEYQEKDFDAKMERTSHRPIPSGQISARTGLIISLLFLVSGVILLYSSFGIVPALLGLFNIVWYNLFYTNLKKVTAFAVVPGSLVGVVPVFIGWTAAGGHTFDLSIVFVGFFLFIWQIPHFWLLMLKYGKQYEAAGFPTINQSIQPDSLRKIIFTWIVATSVVSLLIPLFLQQISIPFFAAIFILNLIFVRLFAKLSFGNQTELNSKKSFISMNMYMLAFMILLIVFHFV